ncbi:MAG: MarR family winged helix-turn-helix transcriptional regulator [Kiloniellales bacterium]
MLFDDPDRTVGFLLHDVSRLMRKRFDRRARALGLTRAQWRVLVHLAPRQGINQSALADILEVEDITLGRHIDRLQETGWVQRRRHPADRRAWRLYLTSKAQPLLDRMEILARDTHDEALMDVSTGERDGLMALLLRIKTNLLSCEAANGEVADQAEAVDAGRSRRVG